jgi:hypothetical protein
MFTKYALPLLSSLLVAYILAEVWSKGFGLSVREGRIGIVVVGGALLTAMYVAPIFVAK